MALERPCAPSCPDGVPLSPQAPGELSSSVLSPLWVAGKCLFSSEGAHKCEGQRFHLCFGDFVNAHSCCPAETKTPQPLLSASSRLGQLVARQGGTKGSWLSDSLSPELLGSRATPALHQRAWLECRPEASSKDGRRRPSWRLWAECLTAPHVEHRRLGHALLA